MAAINQKEYLKRYLGIGKAPGQKKKKRADKNLTKRIKIIDDDLDANAVVVPDDDPFHANEDAPQIVAIIDERPPSLRVDDKTKDPLWQPIGSAIDSNPVHAQMLPSGFKIGKKADEVTIKQEPVSYEDNSPPRRSRRDNDDYSPPRKREKTITVSDDASPPRRSRQEVGIVEIDDNSPLRKSNDDLSPPRARKKTDDDVSPPRKSRRTTDRSPTRRKSRWNPDQSPVRRSTKSVETVVIKQEKEDSGSSSSKLKKTLDGKAAGLQNAKELIEETAKLKQRENELFKKMSKEVSGEHAQTIVRNRKTGRVRDLKEEEEHQKRKRLEEEKNKEKYSRWGRGLVQIETREQRIQEELEEMSKPLARYADDEDLERYLKEQERDGDPMLAYIRSKKRKEAAKMGHSEKPQFQGQFMPNRFGIKPGHRWDGVDRSNGYEKRWFEVQNEKKAQQEETYKWSTEDM